MVNDTNCYLFKILTEDLGDKRYLKKSDYEKYTIPIASATKLGGIKVGSGLSIDSSTGVLTANVQAWSSLTGKPFSSVNSTDFTTTSGILSINNTTWAKKSDVSNSLSGYYTKGQVDNLLSDLKKVTITDVLNSEQLDAVNSGITKAKVSKYDGYDAQIKSKQEALSTQGSAIRINGNYSIYLSSELTGMSDIAVINCQPGEPGQFIGFIKNTLIVPDDTDNLTLLDVYAGKGITVNADTLATSVENAFNLWINYWVNAQTQGDYITDLANETMNWGTFHFPQFINWQDWRIQYKTTTGTIKSFTNGNTGSGIVFRLSSANVKTDESGKVSYQAEINLFDILEGEYDTEQLCIKDIAEFLTVETLDSPANTQLYAKSVYLKIRLSFKYQYDAHDIIDVKLNSSLYVMPD